MLEDKRSWQNISHKNKKEQNGTSHWILKKKKKIFSGRAEYNKTLDPADKDKIISHVQVNKEVHRNSVQHDLDHKITAFQSKIGKVHIMFSLFVTENIQKNFKKTNVQHSARTIYWVVYPWFLSVLEWPLTYRLVTTFFEIGVCPWPDLSSLFQ